jgi:hypothetical protein
VQRSGVVLIGMARHGGVWIGMARHGGVRQGGMGWLRRERARTGEAWSGRRGSRVDWQDGGTAGQSVAGSAVAAGWPDLATVRRGEYRHGSRGLAWRWRDWARRGDDRPDETGFGRNRLGAAGNAWRGMSRSGLARHGRDRFGGARLARRGPA